MNKKEKLLKRIEDLRERISLNNYDIEWGEDSDFKKISRADNRFCKERLKELEKEYRELEIKHEAKREK